MGKRQSKGWIEESQAQTHSFFLVVHFTVHPFSFFKSTFPFSLSPNFSREFLAPRMNYGAQKFGPPFFHLLAFNPEGHKNKWFISWSRLFFLTRPFAFVLCLFVGVKQPTNPYPFDRGHALTPIHPLPPLLWNKRPFHFEGPISQEGQISRISSSRIGWWGEWWVKAGTTFWIGKKSLFEPTKIKWDNGRNEDEDKMIGIWWEIMNNEWMTFGRMENKIEEIERKKNEKFNCFAYHISFQFLA